MNLIYTCVTLFSNYTMLKSIFVATNPQTKHSCNPIGSLLTNIDFNMEFICEYSVGCDGYDASAYMKMNKQVFSNTTNERFRFSSTKNVRKNQVGLT